MYFAERWVNLNAPHTLELGTTRSEQAFKVEKVADISAPCCRSFSDTSWHAGLISDIPWVHTHASGRDVSTLLSWLWQAFVGSLVLAFLLASFVPECHEGSICDEVALMEKVRESDQPWHHVQSSTTFLTEAYLSLPSTGGSPAAVRKRERSRLQPPVRLHTLRDVQATRCKITSNQSIYGRTLCLF